MSPDIARRPFNRCPSALQSWQPFAPVPRRLAGFVASPSKTALQAVRRSAHVRARLKRAVRFASRLRPFATQSAASVPPEAGKDSGKPWRFDVPPDSSPVYPATSEAGKDSPRPFDRPRRFVATIKRGDRRQGFRRNLSGERAQPIRRPCAACQRARIRRNRRQTSAPDLSPVHRKRPCKPSARSPMSAPV